MSIVEIVESLPSRLGDVASVAERLEVAVIAAAMRAGHDVVDLRRYNPAGRAEWVGGEPEVPRPGPIPPKETAPLAVGAATTRGCRCVAIQAGACGKMGRHARKA